MRKADHAKVNFGAVCGVVLDEMTFARPFTFMTLLSVALVAGSCSRDNSSDGAPQPEPTVAPSAASAPPPSSPEPTPIPAEPERLDVADGAFVSADDGWLVLRGQRGGQVWRTADGAATWQRQYDGAFRPFRVTFLNESHGWIVGEAGAGCEGQEPACAAVLATTDGGITWGQTPIRGGRLIDADLAFETESDGWVSALLCREPGCARENHVLRTRDGGLSWEPLPLPDGVPPGERAAIARAGVADGMVVVGRRVAATGDSGAIWLTHDDGDHWVGLANPCDRTDATSRAPGSPFLLDATTAWIVCYGGAGAGHVEKLLYRTPDSGASWQLVSRTRWENPPFDPAVGQMPEGGGVTDLIFSDERDGWQGLHGPGGTVHRTGDGGSTWTSPLDSIAGLPVRRISLPEAGIIRVLTVCSLWASEDGGVVWRELPFPPPERC